MHIDHFSIFVADLEAARSFYTTFFNAASNGGYHNPRTGLHTYFLTFDGGARLELMQRADVPDCGHAERQGYTHMAFSVGDRAAVDALTERLRAAGYQVLSGPRTTGDGYYESCVLDPEGNRVEITE